MESTGNLVNGIEMYIWFFVNRMDFDRFPSRCMTIVLDGNHYVEVAQKTTIIDASVTVALVGGWWNLIFPGSGNVLNIGFMCNIDNWIIGIVTRSKLFTV